VRTPGVCACSEFKSATPKENPKDDNITEHNPICITVNPVTVHDLSGLKVFFACWCEPILKIPQPGD
jgi:hypothetical protein